MSSFEASVATMLEDVLEPLRAALEDESALEALLVRLGWYSSLDTASTEAIRAGFALDSLFEAADELREGLDRASVEEELSLAAQLVDALVALFRALKALSTTPASGLPSPFDSAGFWDEFPDALIDLLLSDHLERELPAIYAALLLFGVVSSSSEAPSGVTRIAYERRRFDWDRLGDAVVDSAGALRERFGWGGSLDHTALFDAIERLLLAFRFPVRRTAPSRTTLDAYYASDSTYRADVREIALPLFAGRPNTSGGAIEVGAALLPIPPTTRAAPSGLALRPLARGALAAGVQLSRDVSFVFGGGMEAGGGVGITILPGVPIALTSAPSTSVDLSAALIRAPSEPWIVLGEAASHRIEAGGFAAWLEVRGDASDPELVLGISTGTGAEPPVVAIVIQLSEGDGFLRSVLGASEQRFELTPTLTWSSRSGFQLSGQASLEATLPINVTLGVVEIASITVRVGASADEISLTVAATGSLTLGPIAASVDRIGLKLALTPAAEGEAGVLGDRDLTFGFKPPDGLGLVVDAGVVTGGGYLYFDAEDEEYAGVAELSVQDLFALTVIGIVTTELPDGSEGYSFLLIVAAEFQPIQLGFGFTLNGVGGLAAVNRTMLTDVLAAGIRDHTLDSILFPEDPVANAPRIISDLESVFPVDEDRYVFGPMIEIGWGTPSLITAELGVFMELPDPIRIVILGQMAALLPSADAPLVEIHLDSVGVLDFEAGTLSIDASLYDSKILAYALSGDMALRAETGDDPSFALSVGGLNPHFDPPAGFPELRRLTLSLGTGNNPRLSCESYLALTSNTVQFGSAVDAYAEAAGFAVKGHLGFDVLFVLSPFSFIADMDADVALLKGDTELMSVALDVSLSGPTPWNADGKATAKVFGFKVSVAFDVTWGDREDATLPSGDARTPLLAALADSRSWVAALPADTETGASIGALAASEGAILVHPLGSLTLSQTVAPLNVTIERFGSTTPRDWDHFEIAAVELGGAETTTSTVEDDFAPAQFFAMSDTEKLSSPSYEEMDAGVAIGSADAVGGHSATLEVEYEEYIVDDRALPARHLGLYQMPASVFGSLLRQGAGELSLVRATGSKKYVTVGTVSPIATEGVRHVVSSTADLSLRTDIVATGTSRVAAEAALEQYLAAHPAERGALQVVSAFEAVA